WDYLLRETKGQQAKCKDESCGQILHHRSSTSSLIAHMLARHGISVVVKKSKAALGQGKKSIYANKPFYLPTINQFIFFKIEKNTQPTIKTHFKPVSSPESLKEVVARMCAKDGLAFSVFVTSQDLRKAMKALHPVEKLQNTSTGINNLVVDYARKIRESN